MLQVHVSNMRDRQQFLHAAGPLEFGRGPARGDIARYVIQDDWYVSKDHLRVEELAAGQIRIENLSQQNPIWLGENIPIAPGLQHIGALPLCLVVGETTIAIEPIPDSAKTIPPSSQPEPRSGAEEPVNLNLVHSIADIHTGAVFESKAPAPDPQSLEGLREDSRPDASAASLGAVSLFVDAGRPGEGTPVQGQLPGPKPQAVQPADTAGGRDSIHKTIREGTVLGPYKILALLGTGGFGDVYLAEDSEGVLGRVALKIPKSQSLSPEELDRYRHEAKLWRALSQERHPNVLELYNLNRFDGVIAFVMEYVDGSNLAQFANETWQRGPFPLNEAVRIIRHVAEALKVIHSKRVYHGDLKPANVLIRREGGVVKLTDFSISRSVTPRGEVPTRLIGGTPGYMAPELWDGKPTLQSDIFALGVLFYELVTHSRPFEGSDELSFRAAIREGRLKELPSARRPDLPVEIERVLLRCLELAPEDRYGSVGELIEDLQAVDSSQDLVSRLADCIIAHASEEDLAFLVKHDLPNRGYRGGDVRSLVLEFCLDEDPEQILLSCFSKPGLARLAERLGALVDPAYAEREHYVRAVLERLGLTGGGSPRGIRDSIALVSSLQNRLEQANDPADVAGVVAAAAREYERILRDLIRFYGQFLFGRSYERSVVRLARKHLPEYKRDLSRVMLGELIALLESINEHLQGDSAEAKYFQKVFHRPWAISPDSLAGSRVTSVRNRFAHWNETLAQAGLRQMRDMARDMLNEVLDFFRQMEKDGIYPQIVTVERFVTDRFGRKYMICRDDQGRQEKVYTNVTVDPSRHYFFYPTSNPMRIYPVLVPV